MKDPVCGMAVTPASQGGSHVHVGSLYYFCNPRCRERFKSDPGAYLNPKTSTSTASLHFCPMHPAVTSPIPSDCPECGMALEPMGAVDGATAQDSYLFRRFVVSLYLSLPVFFLAMIGMGKDPARGLVGLQWAFCTPVVFWAGGPLWARGLDGLRRGRANMFSLILLGTASAYFYSLAVWAGIAPGSVYFESAAVITTLVLLGQVLEARARGRARDALRALLALAPEVARRMNPEGQEETVSAAVLKPGDRVRVRAGERVPADGVIVQGESVVDESMMTGEPVPVRKAERDPVVGGTLNGNGSFVFRVERSGADSLLAGIVRTVEEAQRSRAPIQNLADSVAFYFVPAVGGVAVLSFALWLWLGPAPALPKALVAAVSVLVVACPCALGLATPMSILVALGRGAREGVLIRDAETLQKLARVDLIAFDKTGTLTLGEPRLVEVRPAAGWGGKEVLRLAASLERAANHPLARAFLAAAREDGVSLAEPSQVVSRPGEGVSGEVDGRRVEIRRPADPSAVPDERLAAEVWVDGLPAGAAFFEDPPRPESGQALFELSRLGVEVALLTGDRPAAAEQLARRLGIGNVHAGLRPDDKRDLIRLWRRAGRRPAMAGDGVNDAPALAEAEAGLALGAGADAAKLTAGLILVKGDLSAAARAIRLARDTMRNVKQNLFFAFVYNLLGVVVAAGLFYPWTGWLLSPMIAGAAMSFSSVSVIANALRLRRSSNPV